ncbi:MAG TPA: hypothetical protein VGO35_08650 [Gammaproteobacteria bacterium]|jgi:hypothetical protein|nr:hypothetical protein [Gammaproteobacteria bacterium]
MKKIILAVVIGAMLGAGAMAYAGGKHPNLNEAHNLVKKAIEKLDAAQKVNEFDLGGHAAKAKDLLDQAESEIKQAKEAANGK